MSFKVYQGYRLKKKLSAQELRKVIETLQGLAQPICNRLYHEVATEFVQHTLDLAPFKSKESIQALVSGLFDVTFKHYPDSLWYYLNAMTTQHEASPGQRFHSMDVRCRISLYPQEDQLLLLLHSRYDSDYDKALTEAGFELYEYWNNSDIPEGVSAKDWKTREANWNDALRFSETGLMSKLGELPDYPMIDLIQEKLKAQYEDRVRRRVSLNLEQRYPEVEAIDKRAQTDPEWQARWEDETQRVKALIPETYDSETIEDLSLAVDSI